VRTNFHGLALLLVLLASPDAHAGLVNLDDDSIRTGYVANLVHESLRYDADSQWMTYNSLSPFNYSNRLGCSFPCEPHEETFDGLLAWGAGVDASGHVLDGGAMTWLGNFGSGLEVLATGSLLQIGSAGSLPPIPLPGNGTIYRLASLQFLFDLNFLDQRVEGMGNRILLAFEQEFESLTPEPFANDFHCAGETPGGSIFPNCDRFSTSGLIGQIAVSEPTALTLLLTAMLGSIGARIRLVGRVRIERTTNRLKVCCSTD
jgi:hypothetical protein